MIARSNHFPILNYLFILTSMKQLRLNFFILGLLSLGLLASCGGDDEEATDLQGDIVGTWRVTAASFTADGINLRDYIVQLYRNLGIPLTNEELAELDESFSLDTDELEVLEFRSDGTLSITGDGSTGEGTWTLAGQTLTIDDGDEQTQYTIKKLTDSEMQLSFIADEDGDLGIPGSEDAVLELLYTLTR